MSRHKVDLPTVCGQHIHVCGHLGGEDLLIGIMYTDDEDNPIATTHMTPDEAEAMVQDITAAIRKIQQLQGKKEH